MIPRKGTTCRAAAVLIFAVGLFCTAHSQTETAMIRGAVTDPTGAMIAEAKVRLIDVDRGTTTEGASGTHGFYTIAGVRPGHYRMEVDKAGFKLKILTGITVNVRDNIEQDFRLEIGPVSDSIAVQANPVNVNTTDGTVSTVVDRQFVGNIPLNGRSFQPLITLSPGVVLAKATESNPGQFSVNGQRQDANYFTVDGVGANLGIIPDTVLNQVGGGAVPATTALGGFNNLVSVDALQEFRVMTSSYAPEFGRTPGGQIQIVTRSGTNQFHGTAFDFFRNDVLDAKDWFNGYNHNPPLPKARERQNDFGGVFGGPIWKDRTFFFLSYEGLRLRQPLTTTTVVPSLAVRSAAVPAIQPFLNAFPQPNGPNLANGFAQFSASYSNPANLDAGSVRIDHTLGHKLHFFGRYNRAESSLSTRGLFGTSLNTISLNDYLTETATGGATYTITNTTVDEFRINWSRSSANGNTTLDSFGGAVPILDDSFFPPAYRNSNKINLNFNLTSTFLQRSKGPTSANEQRQVNLIDNLSLSLGEHQIKFGGDYRRLMPIYNVLLFNAVAVFPNAFAAETGLLSNGQIIAVDGRPRYPVANNLSLYAQDSFRVSSRLMLTYGLRWELNPAPSEANGNDPVAVVGLSSPSTLTLAPKGTKQWSTTYGNVAPRVGIAYSLINKGGSETVLRGGFGIFYDLAAGFNYNAFSNSWPLVARNILPAGTPFPFSSAIQAPAITTTLPAGALFVSVPNLKLPRTYQWNVSIERALGRSQSFTMSYVGAVGRNLLWMDFLSNPNSNFTTLNVTTNLGTSDYHAVQLQFQRQLSRGLQALASYTWSHSLDNGSIDSQTHVVAPNISPDSDRGPSDFDIRHNFHAAVTYEIPLSTSERFLNALAKNWGLDLIFAAQSAYPINVLSSTAPLFGVTSALRPDVVPGVPFYLHDSSVPGGVRLNKAAFRTPPANQQGDLSRNALRGFGLNQVDFTVRRQFSFTERLKLHARAEFFNILNHPNFAPQNNVLTDPLFGQSTQMLGRSLGSGGTLGGFNPLYQIGGPRSIQLALKLQF